MKLTLFSVKIKFGFLFFATASALLCFNTGKEIQYGVLFALVHEIGHLIAIALCGEKPQMINFGLFGMTIVRSNDIFLDYKKEVLVALAGPLMNYIIAVVLTIILCFYNSVSVVTAILVNIILATFNIMPVFALDGGRALECYLKMKYSQEKTERIMKITSLFFLIIMLFIGFYILIISKYNFTFLAISVYLIIMLFIKT